MFFALFLLHTSLLADSVSAINWDKVDKTEQTLFYPGQSSWEWLLTKHDGAKSVRKGAPCLECHEDEEKDMGKLIASGKKLEPSPIEGKPGSVNISVKSTYDDENVYFQLSWKDTGFSSGKEGKYKTKLTLMLGDAGVKEFPVAGCWGVCHDDATHMKSHKGDKKRQLYTSASRLKIKRSGGGDNFVDKDVLDDLLNGKKFLEYLQLRVSADNTQTAAHGYILEKRIKHKKPKFTTKATLKDGIWTAYFLRKRAISGKGFLPINEKHTYTLGIALHEDFTKGRKHYVGFGKRFSLNGDTVISASKQ